MADSATLLVDEVLLQRPCRLEAVDVHVISHGLVLPLDVVDGDREDPVAYSAPRGGSKAPTTN